MSRKRENVWRGSEKQWKEKKERCFEELTRYFRFEALWQMPIHTERRSHDVTLWSVPLLVDTLGSLHKNVCLLCSSSQREWNSHYYRTLLLSLPLQSVKKTNRSQTHWSFFFSLQGLDLFAAMPNSFRPPDGKNKLPVCSWLVVTLLDFWVCVRREGQEVENPPPPVSPPSSSSDWPLSIVHCWENASTFTQSEWIPLGSEVICDLLWTRERRWWLVVGWGWSGGFFSLSVGACASTPCTICSPQTERQRHADTHWLCLPPCVQS